MRAGIICSVFRMSQRWFGGVRFFLVCGLVVEVDELSAGDFPLARVEKFTDHGEMHH